MHLKHISKSYVFVLDHSRLMKSHKALTPENVSPNARGSWQNCFGASVIRTCTRHSVLRGSASPVLDRETTHARAPVSPFIPSKRMYIPHFRRRAATLWGGGFSQGPTFDLNPHESYFSESSTILRGASSRSSQCRSARGAFPLFLFHRTSRPPDLFTTSHFVGSGRAAA